MNTITKFSPASLKLIATTALTSALVLGNTVAAYAQSGYNPGWTANFDNPFSSPMNAIAGIILAVSLIATGIMVICAIVLFIIGKVFHQGKAQEKGMSIILWGLVGAVALASVSGLIFWVTSSFRVTYGG